MRPAGSAARQSSELPAKASIASSVRTKTRSGDMRAILQARGAPRTGYSPGERRVAGFAPAEHCSKEPTWTTPSTAWRSASWSRTGRVWRDAGDWERFRTVWHDDGVMMATWFQGPAEEFIRGQPRGLGARACQHPALPRRHLDRPRRRPRRRADQDDDLAARRWCDGVPCDVVCTGRFYDFLEKRAGRWGLVLRQPIYEKDRIDPVDPAAPRRCSTRRCCAAFPRATGISPTLQTEDRLHRQARHARPEGAGGRGALSRAARAWLSGGPAT